jgi:Family of unknown function (DUF5947)
MEGLLRLRRFLDAPPSRQLQGCELCGAPFEGTHGHVIDLENRRLMCACRPCYLLFTHPGAAGGKLRSVSERLFRLPDAALSPAQWEALDIPVGVAFFLRNSRRDRVLAFYPSPAGATESGLPLETWNEMVAANPELETLEPDTEALLVWRGRKDAQSWIVPVDACYELVGIIRRAWKGFDGGDAWREIDAFFTGLEDRRRSCA